jgi:DsbE subfamily thiol:disulfide oxidoreductase
MAKRNVMTFAPVVIFFVLVGFLAYRLALIGQGNMPNMIPSVMINKPTPVFNLPSLIKGKPDVSSADLKGRVTLVDVFASWCVPCRVEHPYLTKIKDAGIALVGINYKDQPEDARAWLEKLGNPYDAIGSDREGLVGIDFGVYGVPESYLIDKQGVIRYKQTGPLTPEDIQNIVLPLAKELNK